jgi:hypothetical protein
MKRVRLGLDAVQAQLGLLEASPAGHGAPQAGHVHRVQAHQLDADRWLR